MAKKPKPPEHENLERWLVSYADFITLLFATFVVLYALSQTDVAKMIGITPKTFYEKMKIGIFGSDEIQIMIDNLNIADPMSIFFARK